MSRLIDLFAPRGPFDFAVRLIVMLALIGLMNWVRGLIQSGADANGYVVSLRDSTFVGLPFVVLGLALIGHLAQLQRQLSRLAATDMLTSLPNRRAFLDRIAEGPALREGGTFLMVDLDHFKRINDTYGHHVGDLCLRAAADFLRDRIQANAACARLGGEEFGVFVPHALGRADALADQLAAGLIVDTAPALQVRLTMSVGLASAARGTLLSLVMTRADAALYRAKGAGRACAVAWDSRDDLPDHRGVA